MPKASRLKKLTSQQKNLHKLINTQIAAFETLTDSTDIKADTLTLIVEKLQIYYAKLETLDSLILDHITSDDAVDIETEQSSTFAEFFLDILKKAETLLSKSTSTQLHDNIDNVSDITTTSHATSSAKLPKLEIKPFSGDSLHWQEFWDIFQTTIDDRSDLKPIDKLKYLKSYLKGEALRVVDGYRLTASNYSVVIDTLKERFGNPEIAIFAHFEKLLALTPGQNELGKLQQVYDECEKHIRSLVALGLKEETFGKVFTPIILSKLPRSICIQLHRQNGSKPWELSTLRELMREELQAFEMSNRYSSQPNSGSKESGPNNRSNQFRKQRPHSNYVPTQGALSNPSNQNMGNTVCTFCSESHFADQCTKFKTAQERRGQLKGKCSKCLREGHHLKDCKRTSSCFYCKRSNHHSSLCFQKFGGTKSNTKSSTSSSQQFNLASSPTNSGEQGNANAALLQIGHKVQMQTAVVMFAQFNVQARLFFDSGCSRSYITSGLAKKLQLVPFNDEIIFSSNFGARTRKKQRFDVAKLAVPTISDDSIQVSLLIADHTSCSIHKYPINLSKNPILSKVPLADHPATYAEEVSIDILIGADHFYDFVGTERLTLANGMHLIESKLGYMLTGKVPNEGYNLDAIQSMSVSLFQPSVPASCQSMELLWSFEDIGIKDDPYSCDDEVALKHFNDTVRFTDEGRYEVAWPWKTKKPDLQDNYGLALGCLKSLMGRLKNQPEVVKEYHNTIQDQIKQDVIEEVDSSQKTSSLIHYIPHHPVIRKEKATTKLRIVYNASAKMKKDQQSLNECLLRGPLILQDLAGILLRFRQHPIAFACDVEKAFLQIGLQMGERDITRFLWLRDPNKPVDPQNLVIFRFRRVPFGFISSPFLLEATIRHHLQKQSTNVAINICQNIYVDNVVSGVENVSDAIAYYNEAKLIFSSISMNIREWYSNSDEFQNCVAYEDKGKKTKPSILGLQWDTHTDQLSCPKFVDFCDQKVSKRTVLKSISTIYDPCGFFSPILVRGKLLVQNMWKNKFPWDKQLPEPYCQQYKKLRDDLREICDVKIPRLATGFNKYGKNGTIYELHCFCDASAKAYGAVIYLRSVNPFQGKVSVHLLFSRARLAPIRPVTLPRLELMAVVIGVRLSDFVRREIGFSVSRCIIWSDSKCVIHWIYSAKVQTVFVQNRINEIRKHRDLHFRYIPTQLNPADIPSKGTTLQNLQCMPLWWNGPQFLVLSEDKWPENDIEPDNSEPEMVPVAALSKPCSEEVSVACLLDPSKFSSLNRMLRITAWINRFIHNCRSSNLSTTKVKDPFLTSFEIAGASTLWIRHIQTCHFPDSPTTFNRFKHLKLFRDNKGILRCQGRLQFSDLPLTAKYPILLPRDSPFTHLVIKLAHEKLLHAGARQTLSQVRTQYWVPQGFTLVKRVLHRCRTCRKVECGPFRVPDSPPLPWFRVTKADPFAHVGIDYLGPLFVKRFDTPSKETGSHVERNRITKVWVCLFTCAVTRALHLEAITDNSTDQFLMALRRFSAIYGYPKMIISDNSTTFKLADKALKLVFRSKEVQEFIASASIQWKFIPAMSPWMGGFYERLIGSVKRSLRKVLGSQCLTLVQLQILLAEIAGILNSRPLVPLNEEAGEMALTPAHFLGKNDRGNLPGPQVDVNDPDFSFENKEDRKATLLLAWFKGQRLLDRFWTSWHKNYLTCLRDQALKNLNPKGTTDVNARKGYVVLLKEPHSPRVFWRLGKITDVHYSSDGKVRSAFVRLANGKVVTRPLTHLYPIEDGNAEEPSPNKDKLSQESSPISSSIPKQTSHKPIRRAAQTAQKAIKDQLQYLETDSD